MIRTRRLLLCKTHADGIAAWTPRRMAANARAIRAAFHDGTLPAKLAVTAIILLTVLGGLEVTPPEAWIMAVYLVLSASGIHIAVAFSEIIGRDFKRRETRPEREFREFLLDRNALSALSLWLAASAVFTVSALGYLSLATAFWVAQMGLVALLFGLGFLSRHINGRPLQSCLWGGASVAFVGLLLSDLRLLAELTRSL